MTIRRSLDKRRLAIMMIASLAVPTGYTDIDTRKMVVTLGSCAINTSLGRSQNFPAANPITDAFYQYTANNTTQTRMGFNGFIGREWQIYTHLALQTGLYYAQTNNFEAKGTLLQGADLQSSGQYTYQYTVLTRQLLAASKLLYLYKEHIYPYAIFGLGAAFNKAYQYTTTVPPLLTFTRIYNNNTQTSFSYKIGIGIDADIAPHFRAGLGYSFIDLGQVKLGNAFVNTTSVSGTLTQNHLYANELTAQLTWAA